MEAMDGDFSTTEQPRCVEKVAAELALDEGHLRVFSTALTNVLGTKIAETTFAQIVDGLPLADVAFSIRGHRDTIYDAVFKHRHLCPGVIARTRAFRDTLDPARLEVEVNVSWCPYFLAFYSLLFSFLQSCIIDMYGRSNGTAAFRLG